MSEYDSEQMNIPSEGKNTGVISLRFPHVLFSLQESTDAYSTHPSPSSRPLKTVIGNERG